jgi:hypothetical protein
VAANLPLLIIRLRRALGVLFFLPFLLLLIWIGINHGNVDDIAGLILIIAFFLLVFVGLPSLLIASGFQQRADWSIWTALAHNTVVMPLVGGLIFTVVASATIDRPHLYFAATIAGLISLYAFAETIYLIKVVRAILPTRLLMVTAFIAIYTFLLIIFPIKSRGGNDPEPVRPPIGLLGQ